MEDCVTWTVVCTGLEEAFRVDEEGEEVDLDMDRLRAAALSSERNEDSEEGLGAAEG